MEGVGEATIMEVVFQTESVAPEQGDRSEREKELETELEELRRQQEDLQSELTVLKKQWGLLDRFANSAAVGVKVSCRALESQQNTSMEL